MQDLNLGQLLHTLLHDISPWDKDGWELVSADNYEIHSEGIPEEYLHHHKSDDTGRFVCLIGNRPPDFGESNAFFIAASPAMVARLIKVMVELEIELYDEREETCQRQPGYWDWRRGHVLTELGISASDWKLLLERLGEG